MAVNQIMAMINMNETTINLAVEVTIIIRKKIITAKIIITKNIIIMKMVVTKIMIQITNIMIIMAV